MFLCVEDHFTASKHKGKLTLSKMLFVTIVHEKKSIWMLCKLSLIGHLSAVSLIKIWWRWLSTRSSNREELGPAGRLYLHEIEQRERDEWEEASACLEAVYLEVHRWILHCTGWWGAQTQPCWHPGPRFHIWHYWIISKAISHEAGFLLLCLTYTGAWHWIMTKWTADLKTHFLSNETERKRYMWKQITQVT